MFVVIDWIDELIIARESEELDLLQKKVELVQEAIDVHPHATRADVVSIAQAIDAEYPTPLLNAIQRNTN
jgi:hypothetical protein